MYCCSPCSNHGIVQISVPMNSADNQLLTKFCYTRTARSRGAFSGITQISPKEMVANFAKIINQMLAYLIFFVILYNNLRRLIRNLTVINHLSSDIKKHHRFLGSAFRI